jgi:ABC-type dipeptide/oligopeptide/nickel transport system permease component
MIMSVIITLVLGIPAGVIAGVRPNSWPDYFTRTTAVFGLSIPNFWLGTLFILLPAIWFNWTPPFGRVSFFDDPARTWFSSSCSQGHRHLFGGGRHAAGTLLVPEVLRQDYARPVQALPVDRHLEHAEERLIPRPPGRSSGGHAAADVIAEQIFALPGMGLSRCSRSWGETSAVQANVLAAVTYAVNLMVTWSMSGSTWASAMPSDQECRQRQERSRGGRSAPGHTGRRELRPPAGPVRPCGDRPAGGRPFAPFIAPQSH